MTKTKEYLKKLFELLKHGFHIVKARTMTTQLIFTIILIFLSFFVLQSFLNNTFFQSYYTQREFERIQQNIDTYVSQLKETELSNQSYDTIFDYTSANNAYSVIVDREYQLLTSSYNNYSIIVEENNTSDLYEFYVPNNDNEYSIDDIITVKLIDSDNNISTPYEIYIDHVLIYSIPTEFDSNQITTIEGTVETIKKPNNLNFLFENNVAVQTEISKLQQLDENPDLLKEYSKNNSWYLSDEGPNILVFVNDLEYNTVVTIIPIVNTTDVIEIVSGYNYYIYLTALVIIFLWSFRMSSIISKPIQNIELVAREIANLNFSVEAHEYNNKENESLSKSINLISENLKETLDTINNKNDELTNLYEEQSKQIALKKQLVSSISHELKTPLMIMQVTIQGILDGIIDHKHQEAELMNVIEEINKSSIMIQDMLQIYRLDDANTKLDLSLFNLGESVCFYLKEFDIPMQKYQFDVEINVDKNIFIEADQKLIKRVISNFITNAIKYTPVGEKIYIEVSQTNKEIYFELKNFGTTITKEEIQNVWQPFYRIEQEDTTKRKTKGSGIGLYLVSEILKAHNYEYGMDSKDNYVKSYFKIQKNNHTL